MKKKIEKILFLVICLSLVVSTFACSGQFIEGNFNGGITQKPSGSGSSGGSSGSSDDDDVFTVTIESDDNISQAELSAIQVIWTNIESNNGTYYTSYCNAFGQAMVSGLDGNYRVTLSNLPENFTYNPNIYTVDNDNKDVNVRLYKITTIPGGKTGTDWYADVCRISTTGIYRAVLTADNFEDGMRFQYEPTFAGDYSIESMIDITANKLNPYLDKYSGTFANVNLNSKEIIDGGGAENTYTKNFRYEIQITSQKIGNVFNFCIRATCTDEDVFPINIDFILERDGEYSGAGREYESDEVLPTHDFEAAAATAFTDTKGSFKHISEFAGNNGLLDGNDVAYFENEGYYYVVNSKGEKYKRLYVVIGADFGLLTTDTRTGFLDSKISLRWIEEYDKKQQKKVYYNYYDFIHEYYGQHLYDGAYYPVTEELKLFLQRFSVANRYFNDGNGWGESYYQSSESNQWLFMCGYFA